MVVLEDLFVCFCEFILSNERFLKLFILSSHFPVALNISLISFILISTSSKSANSCAVCVVIRPTRHPSTYPRWQFSPPNLPKSNIFKGLDQSPAYLGSCSQEEHPMVGERESICMRCTRGQVEKMKCSTPSKRFLLLPVLNRALAMTNVTKGASMTSLSRLLMRSRKLYWF